MVSVAEFNDQIAEWQHRTRTTAVWATSTLARNAVPGFSVSALARGGVSEWAKALGYLGMGLSVGVRLYIVNEEHSQQIKRLTGMYRQEIGAFLGVPANQVGEDELRKAASEIPSLHDALERNDKRRNSKMVAWIGGGLLAGVLLVSVALPLLGAGAGLTVLGIGIPALGLQGGLLTLAAAAVSTGLFHFSKEAVESVGKHVFGITEPTVHDRIQQMDRQLRSEYAPAVTEAQVFKIFLTANPSMDKKLEQMLGKPFDGLDRATQQALVQQYSPDLGLEQIVSDLNHHQMRPQELIFRANGRASGVPRLPEPPASRTALLQGQMQERLSRGKERAGELIDHGKEQAAALHQATSARIHDARAAMQDQGAKGAWRALISKQRGEAPSTEAGVDQRGWVERTGAPSPANAELGRG